MTAVPTLSEKKTTVRRQHFIPRHYLRQFGYQGTEQISLARIEPYQYVARASIGKQCQEDYFYGDDGELEALLGLGEQDIAPVLVEVCRKREFKEAELGALRLLASLLHVRTRKAVEAAKLLPKRVFFEVIKHAIEKGELPPPPDGWTQEMADVDGMAKMLICTAIPCWFELMTLKGKLLQAPKNASFITSDHPVLLLNQFALNAHPIRSFVGFAQSGFQLLLPIDSRLCLYLYDEKTYKAGTRHGQAIDISSHDVEMINALQIQSAESCVYFNATVPEHRARVLIEKYKGLRRPIGDGLRTLTGKKPSEQMLYLQAPALKVPEPWGFSRFLNSGKIQPGTRRDPNWTKAIGRMMDDLENGKHCEDIAKHMEQILTKMADEI